MAWEEILLTYGAALPSSASPGPSLPPPPLALISAPELSLVSEVSLELVTG